MKLKPVHLRLLTYAVMAYLLLAFTWWAVLLYTKNQDAFMAKSEYLRLIYVAENKNANPIGFLSTPEYQTLQKEYTRQEWMIFGEVSAFAITLIVGLFLINRAYNQRLRAINQQRNFLLSVTHELRTPITSIRLMLETIKKRTLERDKLEHLSGNALSDVDRLNSLVTNLLYSAKIDSLGKIHKETVLLDEIVANVIEDLSRKYPGAEILFEKGTGSLDMIGDKKSMRMLIENLVDNALKYSKNKPVQITTVENENKITLTVSDQGRGIPKEERRAIFSQFYRVGNENTRSTPGTGLGLYICRKIVEAHRGTIEIRENEPMGTRFVITLPKA